MNNQKHVFVSVVLNGVHLSIVLTEEGKDILVASLSNGSKWFSQQDKEGNICHWRCDSIDGVSVSKNMPPIKKPMADIAQEQVDLQKDMLKTLKKDMSSGEEWKSQDE